MGLLSGLGGMGLGGLEGMSLYENPDKPVKKEQNDVLEEKPAKESSEANYVFAKSFTCPVCGNGFKALTVKAGKARLVGTDKDLRPRYEGVEPLKYDAILCPSCGYAALSRNWVNLTPTQCKNIKSNISASYVPKSYSEEEYTFDEALERCQMALAGAIVKQAKNSEKAYICLKTGWLLRAKSENLNVSSTTYMIELEEILGKEEEFLKNALTGFASARQNESYPIAGMDECTLDYLLASLYLRFEEYENAAKLVGKLLTSKSASSRMKEKARDLKDEIMEKLKK